MLQPKTQTNRFKLRLLNNSNCEKGKTKIMTFFRSQIVTKHKQEQNSTNKKKHKSKAQIVIKL